MEQFRGGLVFKVHSLLYHSTLGSRVTQKKKSSPAGGVRPFHQTSTCPLSSNVNVPRAMNVRVSRGAGRLRANSCETDHTGVLDGANSFKSAFKGNLHI